MSYTDLRDWIEQARALGEVRDVRGASWQEDIGRITEMLHHTDDSPAVLFDDIPGYPRGYRILANANATRKRLALTLGLPLDIDRRPLMDRFLEMTESGRAVAPRYVKDGPVFENVLKGDDIDILRFPSPKWHPLDGGRYLGTGVCDVLKDPDSDWVNIGTYRVMVQDSKSVSVYISPGKHGRQFRDKYFSRHEPCPVAVVCGVEPLLFVASSLEVPQGVSEYDWAGGIRGEPYEVVTDPITGLPIPARAEIVLVGFLRDDHRRPEGPFGEWTGYYASGERDEPVLDVQAVYHRNDPIILGVPPNKPPYEPHRYREYLRSALLLREMKAAGVPGVVDAHCFGVGGCRLLLAVSIQQRFAGHARQAAHIASMCRVGAYLGRMVVVVDEDIDVTDINDVMWAVLTRSDPERSLDIIHRAWSGPLDPAIRPDLKGFNSRLLIDATKPWEWRDKFPVAIGPDAETKRETRKKWGWILQAGGDARADEPAPAVARARGVATPAD
ncbi:MAG: UbiD family decarboxylase [Chloroflexi bacterium]|nr:UbiD family decarboxylase [Chloroflexota bacterium]